MVRYKKRGRKTRTPSKEEFDFLYYDLGLSAQEMAKRYDIAIKTVYNLATEYRKMDEEK